MLMFLLTQQRDQMGQNFAV
jgi:hypothetical protein